MAFGDVKGTFSTAANSITNPFDGLADATFSVSIGDLIYCVLVEQTALTVTAFADSLGNTYTPCTNGDDAVGVTARAFYSIVTVAGTFTSGVGFVRATATASGDNVVNLGVAFEGPFNAIDKNPANSVSADLSSPFTCPATGTLSQADELIVAWAAANHSTAYTADSPNLEQIELASQTLIKGIIGSQVVAVTTTVSPTFSAAANPTNNVLGTTSFSKNVVALNAGAKEELPTVLRQPSYKNAAMSATGLVQVTMPPAQLLFLGWGAESQSGLIAHKNFNAWAATISPGEGFWVIEAEIPPEPPADFSLVRLLGLAESEY